jgi:hypothetical protein
VFFTNTCFAFNHQHMMRIAPPVVQKQIVYLFCSVPF